MCASLIVSSSSNSCDSFIFDGVTTISNTSDGFYLIINVSITVSDAIPIYPKCEHTQTLPLINFYRIYLCVCALLNWPNLMSRWLIVPMLNVRRWRSRCIQWKCVFCLNFPFAMDLRRIWKLPHMVTRWKIGCFIFKNLFYFREWTTMVSGSKTESTKRIERKNSSLRPSLVWSGI